MAQAPKKKKGLCVDCQTRYAQELGRCRRCWRLRIEGNTQAPNVWRSEPAEAIPDQVKTTRGGLLIDDTEDMR